MIPSPPALDPLFERAGCTLHGSDSGGDGIPLVFCHGAGLDSGMFAPQAEHLAARGHRVVLWDLRGHGASRPAGSPLTGPRAIDDLMSLMRELRLSRPVLIGQSLGGNLAQEFVRSYPGFARGLVVIDSTWNAQALGRGARLALRLAVPGLRLIPERSRPRVLARASAETPEARAWAEEAFARQSRSEFLEAWAATVGMLAPDPGYRTPVPLALVRGDRDRTGDIRTAMPRWAAHEGVEETVIPGAGHLAQLDDPAAVNAAIDAFLDALPPLAD